MDRLSPVHSTRLAGFAASSTKRVFSNIRYTLLTEVFGHTVRSNELVCEIASRLGLSRASRDGVVAAMTHAALGDPQGRCAACRCSRLLVLGAYTRPMLDFPVAFAPVKV